MNDQSSWFRDTPESRRMLEEERVLLNSPGDCGRGVCAAPKGHEFSCAVASGWADADQYAEAFHEVLAQRDEARTSVERERRAAKVEALREAARAVRAGYSPIGLETWADEIERGDR